MSHIDKKGSKIKKIVRDFFDKDAAKYHDGICDVLIDKVHIKKVLQVADIKNSEIMEIGCGTGRASFEAAKSARHVYGVDLSGKMIKKANEIKKKNKIDNIELNIGDAENLAFEDKSFDVIIVRYSFHHFSNLKTAVREFYRTLKPDGIVVVADIFVPEDHEIDHFINSHQHPGHVRHYTINEIQNFFLKNRFHIEKIIDYPLKFSMNEAKGYMTFMEWKKFRKDLIEAKNKVKKFLRVRENNNKDIIWNEPGRIIKFRKMG